VTFFLAVMWCTFAERHDAVFVVGSLDETIMLRGMRYHPIDIENTIVRCHPKICEWSVTISSISGSASSWQLLVAVKDCICSMLPFTAVSFWQFICSYLCRDFDAVLFNAVFLHVCFWYRPTRVVPDKRPLNGCCCCCCCCSACLCVGCERELC